MGVHVISVPILDDAGKTRALNLYCDDSETIANVQLFVTDLIPALDAVTGGKIVSANVTMALAIGTPKASPLADHFNTLGALMAFGAADTQYRHGLYVPCYRHSLISAGAIANSGDTQTFQELVLSGGGHVALTNKAAQALDAFLGVERTTRKQSG